LYHLTVALYEIVFSLQCIKLNWTIYILSMVFRVARSGEKMRIWLLLAAIGALKFCFGALLRFGLLFKLWRLDRPVCLKTVFRL